MEKDLRAKEIALECGVLAFFAVALVGIVAGAESYIAVLRGLVAAGLVAFGARFPARVVLGAMEPPAEEPAEETTQQPVAGAAARETPRPAREQQAT